MPRDIMQEAADLATDSAKNGHTVEEAGFRDFRKNFARTVKPPSGELGTSFESSYLGFYTGEYVPELMGSRALDVFDKMQRNDGMVKATLRALKMPLLGATWEMEPGTDDDKGKEIAERVERNLLSGMSITWSDFLREALDMLPYGFSAFEHVWDVDTEGFIYVRKLAPRLQRTIVEWVLEGDGGLKLVKHNKFMTVNADPNSRGVGTIDTVDIPVEKLLVFTNEKKGANFAGVSVLRPAYKHWWMADSLYKIFAMSAERHGIGTPYIKYPPGAKQTEIDRAEKMMAEYRSNERGYIATPSDWEFDIVGVGSSRGIDVLPMVQHHMRMISTTMLAQFLTLGATDVGSYALSNDQTSLFLLTEQSVGDYICDIINRYLIKRDKLRGQFGLVDFNYPDVKPDEYPRLVVRNIETRKAEDILKGLADAVQKGLITADDDIEDFSRGLAGAPLLPRDENGELIPRESAVPAPVIDPATGLPVPPTPPGTPPPNPTPPQDKPAPGQQDTAKFKRMLTPFEEHVDFAAMTTALDRAQSAMEKAAEPIRHAIILGMANLAAFAVEGKQPDRLRTAAFTAEKQALAEALQVTLMDLYRRGRTEVRREFDRQRRAARHEAVEPLPLAPAEEGRIIEARATAAATRIVDGLRFATLDEALVEMRASSLVGDALIENFVKLLTSRAEAEFKTTAGYTASEALNMGRVAEAELHRSEVSRVDYSALMDAVTCSECGRVDGRTVEMGSAEYYRLQPPYRECEGRGRCRCVFVYVLKSETEP